MTERAISLLSAGLLTKSPISLDMDALPERLQTACGRVERVMSDSPNAFHAFAFLDYVGQYEGGEAPAQMLLSLHEFDHESEAMQTSLQQTWGWQSAQETVSQCTHELMVSQMLARALPRERRVELFHKVLGALLDLLPVEAIHSHTSAQFVSVRDYRESQAAPNPDPLYSLVNVRMFGIRNGQENEVLMDTLGMAALDLPDVQCHFAGLEPNQIAQMLFGVASYLFEQGDVIQDGHTISGIDPESRYTCQHEVALIQPVREVLDINPGPPHAAGQRE